MYEQEPRTCWSTRTRIGLELDAASKCDGNRGRDVSYGTALFLSRICGHFVCETREEKKGWKLREPYSPRVMKTWTAHRCTGKPDEIKRSEVERIMLRWRFNVYYRAQSLLIYKTDRTASTHRKPIIYCAIRNQKGKRTKKKLKLNSRTGNRPVCPALW